MLLYLYLEASRELTGGRSSGVEQGMARTARRLPVLIRLFTEDRSGLLSKRVARLFHRDPQRITRLHGDNRTSDPS
jgi:hypothetical protein